MTAFLYSDVFRSFFSLTGSLVNKTDSEDLHEERRIPVAGSINHASLRITLSDMIVDTRIDKLPIRSRRLLIS